MAALTYRLSKQIYSALVIQLWQPCPKNRHQNQSDYMSLAVFLVISGLLLDIDSFSYEPASFLIR